MQPQHKNLLLFIVLSFLIFVSWTALQNTLTTRPTPKKFEPIEEPTAAEVWAETPATLAGQIGGMAQFSGLGYPVPGLAQVAAIRPDLWVPRETPKPPPVIVAKEETKEKPPHDIVFGDSKNNNLRVTLTTL